MEQEINTWGYILNMGVLAVIISFFMGIMIKIGSMIIAILAYPT